MILVCFAAKLLSMFDMMKKLQEAQRQMKEIKSRLDNVSVQGKSDSGIVVTANGNRAITNIELPDTFTSMPKSEFEQAIKSAVNQAIANADKVNESEMKSAASGMMPGLGNLMSKGS